MFNDRSVGYVRNMKILKISGYMKRYDTIEEFHVDSKAEYTA